MKIGKVFRNFFQTKQLNDIKKSIPPCPVIYDRNNVTSEEFREYVHWLAQNGVNRTFYEPDKFITKAERETLEKRKAELFIANSQTVGLAKVNQFYINFHTILMN